ncbi:helix-turn-helix domain-containing protein [Streptomyces sp. NBRC 109706]|uniref:helix-turn-helix domain-containing protein n=1 Tax=Streptomyces sp. NBRC 109706 TaxID=1550035 RepID=UPI0007837F34|nr:helix-turn-helix domain-containing protein [Streptomyces sp. NBRC 109706]
MPPLVPYLTPEDLVTLLKLPSVETIYQWRKTRSGPRATRIGKHLRYHPNAVAEWLDANTDHAARIPDREVA